jgi:hypothetical protein
MTLAKKHFLSEHIDFMQLFARRQKEISSEATKEQMKACND